MPRLRVQRLGSELRFFATEFGGGSLAVGGTAVGGGDLAVGGAAVGGGGGGCLAWPPV